MAEPTAVLVEVALAIVALITSIIVLMVYRQLKDQERVSMASFQLHPEEVKNDFRIILFVVALFFVAILTLNYGIILQNNMAWNIGIVLSLLSSIIPAWIFYRWWRRFR